MSQYDLIVIGAGPGGYVAAIRAAQLGLNVACVEKEPTLGGVCLNWGCIPSKALLDSSQLYHDMQHTAEDHGIKLKTVKLDLPTMMSRKDSVVQQLTRGVAGLFRKNKVEHIHGSARIAGPGKVVVEDDSGSSTEYACKHILIASGSVSRSLPGIEPDYKQIITSKQAIALEKVPQKLLVIGAGAIGLELGSVWKRLGSEVHVIEFLDRIAPGFDLDMAKQLQRTLEKQGLTFQMKTGAKSTDVKDGKVHVKWESGDDSGEYVADIVLLSVGRGPNTEGLGLEEAGIKTERGFITVNERFETSVQGIYAIGDVIGGAMLAHKAEEEGAACVEMIAGHPGHVNYTTIPYVVYTHPELAGVGLTEDQAKERGIEVRVGKFPFQANGRAKAMHDVTGLVKVIADAKTDRLLGMHILGSRASDMIAEGVVAMQFASSAEDIARTMHAHPTLPEAVKEAAMAAYDKPIHI